MAISAMALSVFGFKRESRRGAVGKRRAGWTTLTTIRNALVLSVTAFALVLVAPSSVTAQSGLHKPRNVVWAPGAQRTKFGGIASGAKTTPFGVAKGQKTNFGYIAPGAKRTAYGVTSGQKTNFGLIGSGAQRTSYGVSGGQRTSTGVIARGGQKTSFGAVGAGCRKTPFGFFCSDVRLKRDVVEVARLDNGLGLYRYRYLWSDKLYVGVMAQEVAKLVPYAVMRGADGYLRVNYAELGLRLRTWDDWVATH
jgi:hypothetical protein